MSIVNNSGLMIRSLVRPCFIGMRLLTVVLLIQVCGRPALADAHPGATQSATKNAIVSTSPASSSVFHVANYGAVGDGKFLNTTSIQRAIDVATEAGGGRVYFPSGNYRCGTIRLKSNVSLYLGDGCILWGSKDLEDYDKISTHLIYAKHASNIAINGPGEINGNGPSYWDNGRLQKWLKGEIELPRTKDMIRFDHCQNVSLGGIRVKDGAFWNIGFGDCAEVSIHDIQIRTGVYEDDGPNTDGINLWNCQKVTISDCDIITGDDCIVVLGNSRDVNIRGCQLQTSETALMISGVRNLTFANSTIHDSGCGIGFRVWNNILVNGVTINNIVMDVSDRYKGGGTAIYIWSFPVYTETELPPDTKLPEPGVLRNVIFSNMVASANGLVCVNGAREGYVNDLTLDNIQFTMNGGKVSEYNAAPPYPYPIYGFHHGSPYGLFFRYVDGLKLRDIQVRWNNPEKAEWGSALRCWNTRDVEIEGFDGRSSNHSQKASISLKDVSGAFIHNCIAPRDTTTFLELSGKTDSVTLTGNDLHRVREPVKNRIGVELFMQHNRLPTKN